MIPGVPVTLVRRTDGPRGRAVRLVGFAQLEGSIVLIEADAGGPTARRQLSPEHFARVFPFQTPLPRQPRKQDRR